MSNRLFPGQIQRFVGPDLGTNSLKNVTLHQQMTKCVTAI